MTLFCRTIILLMLMVFNAQAFSGPKGLYKLQYPVDMPSASLTTENGGEIQLLDNNADLTILIFWSQSCSPCLREMKALEKFYKKAAEDNIRVMLISASDEWNSNEEERKFLTKYGAPTLPFYNDTNSKLSLSLGIGSTPYTVIMNNQKKKVAIIQGEANWNSGKLYQMIKELAK